ncbi:DUF3391 domain-containing protein [Aliikangiella marina]|uniref:DUF3391 domain-containing protein n=1 Tax=Aliikangiella marina TaxID=1712262 RepID=A0A545THZ8_9GAMM|nr:HD-GYP domain-containing protein [Aliikangiella marina]TQV76791.1 DUF3391 domain-containing protein [Aliikangiella marina]
MPDIRKLPLEELQIGMFVTEIESQKTGVKLKAGGRVSRQELIDKMKAQKVAYVYVDFDLQEKNDTESPTEAEKEVESKQVNNDAPQTATSKIPKKADTKPTSLAKELDNAESLFSEAKVLQEKIFDSAINEEAIELEAVEDTTNEIMGSIFRNQDALMFMTRMKDRDSYLFEHAINTCILMTTFASYLEYDERLIQEMAIGAFLLDIGKTLIPKTVLNKEEKLTDKEIQLVRKHVEYSTKIVENIEGVSPVSLDVVSSHHERLDGSGYPNGLAEDDISTWGRMAAIIDTYDAMTTSRRYAGAKESIQAFRTMLDAPHLYDNELVQQFIKCIGVYPVGSLVKLKSGKIGMVYRYNESNPLKPTIIIFYSLSQRTHTSPKKVDLTNSNEEIEMSIKAEDINLGMNRGLLESLFMQVGR